MMGPTNAAAAQAAAPTGPSLAAVSEIEAAAGPVSVEIGGKSFEVAREPSMLLLSEAATMDEQSQEAFAFLTEFFRYTLADYKGFRRHVLDEHVPNDALVDALRKIAEATTGRPTG